MRQVIHIPDSKIDVIKHLKSQPNMSGYIVQLIEKDMENQILTKEKVIELIRKYGSGNSNEIDLNLLDSINNTLDF